MTIVAWDIETCPLPESNHSPERARRAQMEYDKLVRRGDPETEDTHRKARSLHPALGWICCISVIAGEDPDRPRAPRSYVAASPEEEGKMLEEFWADVSRIRGRTLWLTFNGKGFDGEFLRTRSMVHGVVPTRKDLLDEYPFKHEPHCDLARAWRHNPMTLADACDLLGVQSPKTDFSGDQVAEAVERGDMESVRIYAEGDVIALMACYAKARDFL